MRRTRTRRFRYTLSDLGAVRFFLPTTLPPATISIPCDQPTPFQLPLAAAVLCHPLAVATAWKLQSWWMASKLIDCCVLVDERPPLSLPVPVSPAQPVAVECTAVRTSDAVCARIAVSHPIASRSSKCSRRVVWESRDEAGRVESFEHRSRRERSRRARPSSSSSRSQASTNRPSARHCPPALRITRPRPHSALASRRTILPALKLKLDGDHAAKRLVPAFSCPRLERDRAAWLVPSASVGPVRGYGSLPGPEPLALNRCPSFQSYHDI